MLKTYQRAVKQTLRGSRPWPQFECTIPLNSGEREFIASFGRLEGLSRDDEMELSRGKELIRKLMAQHEELTKERQAQQEANE